MDDSLNAQISIEPMSQAERQSRVRDLWRAHPEKSAEDTSVAVLDHLTKAAVKFIPAVDIEGYATLDMPMENVEAWARAKGVQGGERRTAQRLKAR